MFIPIEIQYQILFNLSLKDLVNNMIISKDWYDLVYDIIKRNKTIQLTTKIMASIIKINPIFINGLVEALSYKQKRKICLFYSYLGQMDLVSKYLIDIPWDHKLISYTISGHINRLMKSKREISTDIHEIISEIPLIQKYGIADHKLDKYTLWLQKIQNSVDQKYLQAQASYRKLPLKIQNDIDSIIGEYDQSNTKILSTETILIKHGNIDALQMMVNHGYLFKFQAYESAIVYNQLQVIQWLASIMIIYKDVFMVAAKFGRIEILKWLHNECLYGSNYAFEGIYLDDIMEAAAKHGQLQVIKLLYLPHNSSSRDVIFIFSAATGGHQEIIDWILEKWSYTPDQLSILVDVHCEDLKIIFSDLVQESNMPIIKWFLNYCPALSYYFGDYAAKNGQLSILDFIIKNEYQINFTYCLHHVSVNNNLEILKYIATIRPSVIKENWNKCMALAMECNNLKIVKWLLQYQYHYRSSFLIKYNVYKIKKSHLDGGKIYHYNTNQKSISYYQEIVNSRKIAIYDFWKNKFRKHHSFGVEL